MRLVVTGCEGQVARSLAAVGAAMGVDVICVGRPALDLAGDAASILSALTAAQPDAIVSAAAYTMVDKAESERDAAFAINAKGAGHVAAAAAALGVPVLHLSTDYVFDGQKPDPYVEDDPTGPTSVYGTSKLEGEQRVAAATANHAIFRTAWVYSPFGANFVKTMLRLGETRDTLSVVADQWGCPTSAEDIARAMIEAAKVMIADLSERYRGVFHLTGAGEANWADFARHVFAEAEALARKPVDVVSITSDQYPSPVKRPANSRLSGAKLEQVFGIALPHWRASNAEVVKALLSTEVE